MHDLGSLLRALLQELLRNPILFIFVIGALASFVGQIFKAIKANAERRTRDARSGRMPVAPQEQAPQSRDAEDIAREIRRMMQQGLDERAEREQAERAELAERAEREHAERARQAERAERAALTERKHRAQAERHRTRRVEVRAYEEHVAEATEHGDAARMPAVPPLAASPLLGEGSGSMANAAAARLKPKAFVIRDLRSAIIASEVLGPPVSLRESGTGAGVGG